MVDVKFLTRVLLNYEIVPGVFVCVDDLVDHAYQEKENIILDGNDVITRHVLMKALREVHDQAIRKGEKRIRKSKKNVIYNLKRRCSPGVDEGCPDVDIMRELNCLP